ncbi:hypothetical protein [Solirubrobacter pauli]|uniref:hypothetical protein n=1 Tax=Solirubrobacter pauli TaxID=166793 RepID=UPI0011C460B2|nr:hypothetical protein [Solirubrobacter pauli]
MISRATTHPIVGPFGSALILPAGAFAPRTDSRSLALLVVAGAITLWVAFCWAANRDNAWDRLQVFHDLHPLIAGLLYGFAVPRENGKRPSKERIPSAIAIAIWGLLLTVVGIVGLTRF